MRDEFKNRGAAEWDLFTLNNPGLNTTGEAKLYESKWFDYRRMHPMRATFELIEEYCQSHRRQYARRFDVHEAAALNLNPMLEGRHKLEAFWNARRKIDALGISYDYYCSTAADLAERCWSHLCRPEDLGNSFIVTRVGEEWKEYTKVTFKFPKDPHFTWAHWKQTPDQLAWREFARQYFSLRADNSFTIKWHSAAGANGLILPDVNKGSY